LLLADQRGHLRFMAASDERARLLKIFQGQVDQGPWFDVYRTAQPVINAALHAVTDRWPTIRSRWPT
jgi:hypothetical protein